MVTAPDTSRSWIADVLKMLGTTANGYNDVALDLWAESEGMPDWTNNWLATERGGYGGYHYNSAGVFVYPSYVSGVRATADTIKQGNMGGIATALTQARSLSFIYDAINASPWCDGCQSGRYPSALYDYLKGLVGGADSPGRTFGVPVQTPNTPPSWDWSDHVRNSGAYMTDKAQSVSGYSQAIRGLG